MARLLLAVMLALSTGLSLSCSRTPARERPVGRTVLALQDHERSHYVEDRPRPVLTHLWYPAPEGPEETAWQVGVFNMGYGAVDAPLAGSSERYPLIVMSHGTGGAAAQLSWMAETLATHGYVVAAVNHHGNTAAEPSYLPQGFALWWERAQDLSFVIGALLDHPKYRARIDPGRIGALGFSLGGWTVLTLAGARVDLERWEKACAEAPERAGCALPPEATFEISELERLARDNPIYRASRARAGQSFSDPRVRAVVALAPSIGFSFDPASLREVPIPVALKVGAKDDQAPPEETTQIEAHVPDASLDILPEVGHYTFLAPCTLRGRWLAPDLCREPGGANRRALHAEVSVAARTFFDAKLERSPGK